MGSPIAVSLAAALLVMLILLIIRPPFIYTRRQSKIHPDFYVESFSPVRLLTWTAIAGLVTLVGADAQRLYKTVSGMGTAISLKT